MDYKQLEFYDICMFYVQVACKYLHLPNGPSVNQCEVFEAPALVFTLSRSGLGQAINLNEEGAKKQSPL